MTINTLEVSRTLGEGGVFTEEQAKRLATVLFEATSEERLRRIEIAAFTALGLLTLVGGMVATSFWQVYTLRGEVSELRGEIRTSLASIGEDLRAIREARP